MIEVKKPTTILDVIQGKKVTARRIDFEDGDQDHIWKASDQKATKAELTQAREDMETQIADKADASDITSINETLAGKAEQSQVDSLASSLASKAEQSEVDSLASSVADKASQADMEKRYNMLRLRDDNLMTNGYGELGDNTNFSQFSSNPGGLTLEDLAFTIFRTTEKNFTKTNDELIPISPQKAYSLKYVKWDFGFGFWSGSSFFDHQKTRIYSYQCSHWALNEVEKDDFCELSQTFDVANDLVIYLKSGHAQKWLDRWNKIKDVIPSPPSIIRIGEMGGSGYTSNSGRYMKYWIKPNSSVAWDVSNVDLVNDTITLNGLIDNGNKDFQDQVFPAGTIVDCCCDDGGENGDGLFFVGFGGGREKHEWVISNEPGSRVRIPAYAKYFQLEVRGNTSTNVGTWVGISEVELKEIISTPKTVLEQIEEERPDVAYKNSNILETDIPALPQSKVTNLTTDLNNKASISALARTTHMDIYSNANLQSFVIGPAYSTATAFCTELGLFLEIKTPVWLSQTKLFMKDADNVLVQLYNYENDVVVYEKSFACSINENILSLGVLLPAGRYYFSGTGDNETLAYFPTTSYSITHHFVSVFGGELDPVAFPAFTPGTTSQWAGFYQMTFQVPFKALYLGLLSAKEPNANLIQGAFYHVNDSNYLRTWCFDGTTQISN